eukprot:gene3861-7706_t
MKTQFVKYSFDLITPSFLKQDHIANFIRINLLEISTTYFGLFHRYRILSTEYQYGRGWTLSQDMINNVIVAVVLTVHPISYYLDGGNFNRGGRSGQGGGRGRGGRGNISMSSDQSIMGLLGRPTMSNQAILQIINPPMDQRTNRPPARLNAIKFTTDAAVLPAHDRWRLTPSIGESLNPSSQIVRANHFQVDVTNIPDAIYHYHVYIHRLTKDGERGPDIAPVEDSKITTQLLSNLKQEYLPRTNTPQQYFPLGITYDGRSSLYATSELLCIPTIVEEVDEPQSTRPVLHYFTTITNVVHETTYLIRLLPADCIRYIHPDSNTIRPDALQIFQNLKPEFIASLDMALTGFVRGMSWEVNPSWINVGANVFCTSDRNRFEIQSTRLLEGFRGFHCSLKSCLAGLVLVSDMSVTSFICAGEMVNAMYLAGGFRSVEDMAREAASPHGIHPKVMVLIDDALHGVKLITKHLGHPKKCKGFGPAANAYFFENNNKKISVQQYFEDMARINPAYLRYLPQGKLKFPFLPCVNLGSKKKPVLLPPELLRIPGGQFRSGKALTGAITAAMIRQAAVRPAERFAHLTGSVSNHEGSMIEVINSDQTARAFGLGNISPQPMKVNARLLPPAILQYGDGKELDPKLSGSWNLRGGEKFVQLPPGAINGRYMIGCLFVTDAPPQQSHFEMAKRFMFDLERDARTTGLHLYSGGDPITCNGASLPLLAEKIKFMRDNGAQMILVMLHVDFYCNVKLVADGIGLPTQCVKWKNVEVRPNGYTFNLLYKINTKMGGANHTLKSRGIPAALAPGVVLFQNPPVSLSWVFDKPCMVVGIDVSHPEPGSTKDSTLAIVASMDGRVSQYVARISSRASRVEVSVDLEDSMVELLKVFEQRNGCIPVSILIYRDGVSESQFDELIDREVAAMKGALATLGYSSDHTKITMVVCQKGHHTRLVYEDENGGYVNPCPGLVVDMDITSALYNEFYLNSHTAIQGTAKPVKYSVVYDEIRMKNSELELLTYWLCYLYARCTKSVSMVTPVFYAHWAARRARDLFSAGATREDLKDISNMWSTPGKGSTMFFI